MDPVQAVEDLEKTLPEHHDVFDCRGRARAVKKLAQIPAVRIFQYQRVRIKLPERSVELDYVRRWARSESQQRTGLVGVGGLMFLGVVCFEDESVLGGTILFIPSHLDVSYFELEVE